MANKSEERISILRRNQVEARTGLSRSTIYLFISDGMFPRPIRLGPRSVGWVESEVNQWLVERLNRRDTEKITS